MTPAEIPSPNLSPKEAVALLKRGDVRLVDVREPSEHAAGRIPEAELVPLGTLQEAARDWDRHRPVLIYCQSGRRSERALEVLRGLGFEDIGHIEGGISAWLTAALPSTKSAKAPWSLERQVRCTVGILVIFFTGLGLVVHPGFFALDFFISVGLIFSAVTNTCGMALVLTKMPWNRAPSL